MKKMILFDIVSCNWIHYRFRYFYFNYSAEVLFHRKIILKLILWRYQRNLFIEKNQFQIQNLFGFNTPCQYWKMLHWLVRSGTLLYINDCTTVQYLLRACFPFGAFWLLVDYFPCSEKRESSIWEEASRK